MEMGVAVISGNLPLLKPLFERYFRSAAGTKNTLPTNSQELSRITARRGNVDEDGFERISDDTPDDSVRAHSTREIEMDDQAILVKKEFTIVSEQHMKPKN
jgi:hypothetical protein